MNNPIQEMVMEEQVTSGVNVPTDKVENAMYQTSV